MASWLYNLLIGGCFGHKWETLAVSRWKGTSGEGPSYTLRCTKCGTVKYVKLGKEW